MTFSVRMPEMPPRQAQQRDHIVIHPGHNTDDLPWRAEGGGDYRCGALIRENTVYVICPLCTYKDVKFLVTPSLLIDLF